MRRNVYWGLFIILVSLVVLSNVPTAEAAANLQWNSTNVYFNDNGRLIIEGYFVNAGDTTVDYVNRIDFSVDVRNYGGDSWRLANFFVGDQNVYLRPGERADWTFWFDDASYTTFDQWKVRWHVDYHWVR